MKKSKLLINLALCFVILICFSVSVNAESAYVILHPEDSSAVSNVIGLSKYAEYSAINDINSLFKVYAIVHRSLPGKGWTKVKETLMDVPGTDSGRLASTENANWKLELNPKGWGLIGSKANGKIWY